MRTRAAARIAVWAMLVVLAAGWGERAWAVPTYRVLIDTDLGGDPDDTQSLIHAVHFSDILRVEGWVSTPKFSNAENTGSIRDWIRRADVDALRARGYTDLMTEADLLRRVVPGNTDRGRPASNAHTEGAQLIRDRANAGSASNPLYVFVWGRMTTLARALYEEPGIAGKIRIISLGGNNATNDQDSTDFLYSFRDTHPEMWWLDVGGQQPGRCATYGGMYEGPVARGATEWGREAFLRQHVRGRGTTHDGAFSQRIGDAFPQAGYPEQIAVDHGWLKEGDSPTILYLVGASLRGVGNVDDPRVDGWGGDYQRPSAISPNYYTDLTGATDAVCQSTIYEDRMAWLKVWAARWDRYGGVTDGLGGYWKLDGGVADASGSGNDGTLQGASAWGPGKMNRALWFDGASTFVSVNDDDSLDLTADFTIAAWIKLETSGTVRYLLAKTTPGSDEPNAAGAYVVYKNASNKLCYRASGSNGDSLCSDASIANKAWQHWAIVKDGSTVRFWRDGVVDRTISGVAASQTPKPNSDRLAIGRRGNDGNFWAGRIDDLRIYRRALSEAEVLVLGP